MPAETKSANELATERTVMAADRSLMAWLRTALSMISFGFTIYKLLQGLQTAGSEAVRTNAPRNMGLFLTGMGTVAMAMGTVEYWVRMRGLGFRPVGRASFVMSLIMSAIGLFLFVSILARLL